MSFLIQNAYAESAKPIGAAPEGDLLGVVLPFVFIFVVFYFLILRPQQKKFKTHLAMVSAIKRGDKVVTSGGILGKVAKIDEDGVAHIEIAEGVTVKVLSATISDVVDADKPINDNKR
jgi:preprotein translocase subunit YajC